MASKRIETGYSLKNTPSFDTEEELIQYVLDQGIDPSSDVYIDGELAGYELWESMEAQA